jgi:tetratricopeptide (TPR) repeat protein
LTLDETLQEAIPALLSLVDALPEDSPFLQLDPPQRRQRTLDAVKRILLRESQVQPLLLVFEDLHWIDSETQALLDSLIESLPAAQLLLLVNYRPEYQHGWGSKTYYTQLRLDPLPAESAAEFLEALLGDDPSLDPAKKLLIARTEGNPFFLEESVRTLVETQVFVGASGAYRLAKDLPPAPVPATVQAVLAARIDRLPPEEKQLLQTAAVIGTQVPLPLLQAIAELPEGALHRSVAHLQAAEFLYETSLFPERVYSFKHALTHEVAYGSLLVERRRTLHGRIVEVLEGLAGFRPDDQIERLAHHALRGEVWDKALRYYRQAGDKAMARSAFWEAVACFEQALTALQHLPEQPDALAQAVDLRMALGRALLPTGEPGGRGLNSLREAEALAEALGDQRRLAQICLAVSHDFFRMGAYDDAIAYGRRSLDLSESSGDIFHQARTNGMLGTVYFFLGDYRRAIDVLRRSLAALEGELRHTRIGMIVASVRTRYWLAYCLAQLGEFADGMAYNAQAARIAEEADHLSSAIFAQLGQGLLALLQGNLQHAIPLFERGLARSRDADIRLWLPGFTPNLGLAYTLSGRVAEALPLLDQVVVGEDNVTGGSIPMTRLGEAYLLTGRLEDALRLAERGLALSRDRKERGHQARALRLLGEIAMQRDPPAVSEAETHYQQALALADELGMRPLQAHCHHGLGTLYRQAEQPEQSRAELTTAIEMYRDMEMIFWLPRAEAVLAEVKR